jgi:acetylglutamate kinase
MISNLYYSQFQGNTFVIQAEAEAVEDEQKTAAILNGISDLLKHGIRVAFVFGKSTGFEEELRTVYGAEPHPETNRLVIPENALPRIEQERSRIARTIERLCQSHGIPCCLVPESAVRAERRIGYKSTGVVKEIDRPALRSILDRQQLAIIGFGGTDSHGQFLHVPSVSLAADLAVQLPAQKLLLLAEVDGIFVPDQRRGKQQLSFADLEGLLCLLQKRDEAGNFILAGNIVSKVHASIRAVAGDVSQVHIVSYSRLLDEILTRTGVGTMIERQQSHHVDYAGPEDLEEIERLHAESQRYATEYGTPYVKPLDRAGLQNFLSQTLMLKHRGVIVGKLHATEIPAAANTLLIGGFVIGENHHDSQHGQLLLTEALGRFRERGYAAAAAITASERAGRLFERSGGQTTTSGSWQSEFLARALQRYHPDERSRVRLFLFPL